MKAVLYILAICISFWGNIAFAEEDQAMVRYSELKLDYSSVKSPIQLYEQVLDAIKEIDFFVKRQRDEKATVMISYYSFPEEFWKEMRKIVRERKELQMVYFRYIKDQEEGIDDIYLFLKY